MKDCEVNCVQRPRAGSLHEHITHIGHSGQRWRITVPCAIQRIELRGEFFYAVNPFTGRRDYLAVIRESGKAPYLRAYAEGTWTDTLLAQPDCDLDCAVVWRSKCPRWPGLHLPCHCPDKRSALLRLVSRSKRLFRFRRP